MIKEEFLFCKPLAISAKKTDVKKVLGDFFSSIDLSYSMVSSVCIDVASVMRCQSGLRALIKNDVLCITFTLCRLHKHTFISKTLLPKLTEALKVVVETVNYV